MLTVIKTYGHEQGFSVAFRQYRADSHCRFLHGYALAFAFEFGCKSVDERGWVIDFGALKPLKKMLEDNFDHKLIVSGDDPQLEKVLALHDAKLADVLVWPHSVVCCESFAKRAAAIAQMVVDNMPGAKERGVRLNWCEVREHGANAVRYTVEGS